MESYNFQPDTREARVNLLKSLVERGVYYVPGETIAETIPQRRLHYYVNDEPVTTYRLNLSTPEEDESFLREYWARRSRMALATAMVSLPYCARKGCPHKAEPGQKHCVHCLSDRIFLENACFASVALPLVGAALLALGFLVFAGRNWGWW